MPLARAALARLGEEVGAERTEGCRTLVAAVGYHFDYGNHGWLEIHRFEVIKGSVEASWPVG